MACSLPLCPHQGGRGYPKVGTPAPIQGRYPQPSQMGRGYPKVGNPSPKSTYLGQGEGGTYLGWGGGGSHLGWGRGYIP